MDAAAFWMEHLAQSWETAEYRESQAWDTYTAALHAHDGPAAQSAHIIACRLQHETFAARHDWERAAAKRDHARWMAEHAVHIAYSPTGYDAQRKLDDTCGAVQRFELFGRRCSVKTAWAHSLGCVVVIPDGASESATWALRECWLVAARPRQEA